MSLEVGGRQAECPNCGGPIEWKLGSSAALVCQWCRSSVVRTDRDLKSLGKVADLVPTLPLMAVGDTGTVRSTRDGAGAALDFTVVGRIQLDHGSGPWDEWYVGFSDGSWGFLAKAQGAWMVTSRVGARALPPYDAMVPGQRGTLPQTDGSWTVAERGTSTVLSAEGELPDPVVVGEVSHYVDLHGNQSGFATIDYGTPAPAAAGQARSSHDAPVLYLGERLPDGAVTFRETAVGPRPEEKVQVQDLRCPSCGGPCPILTPETTERAACPSCNALLDFNHGAFEYLGQLNQPAVKPIIPIGTRGRLSGEEVMCIGLMERSTDVEGIRYSWREYLLHSEHGYRWLMEDAGHFTWVAPISAADVNVSGHRARYQGKAHKLFASGSATVRFVTGEFYWKVQIGDQSQTRDFIAPPTIVSEDRSQNEVNWSAGRYVPQKEVWRGFKLPGRPVKPYDVAPAQPNPIGLLFPAIVSLLGIVVLGVMVIAFRNPVPERTLVDGPIEMPRRPEPNIKPGAVPTPLDHGPSVHITESPPFELPKGSSAVDVTVVSDLGQGWLGIGAALVHQGTGAVTSFSVEQDRFHATGSPRASGPVRTKETIGGLEPGTYILRLDPRWARKGPFILSGLSSIEGLNPALGRGQGSTASRTGSDLVPEAKIEVRNRVPSSSGCACFSFFLVLLPLPFALTRKLLFESRRWRNSSV